MGHQVAWFFGLTLAIAWGVPVGVLFGARVFGFDPPRFSTTTPVVAWSPALAACAMVTFTRGVPGLKSFMSRLANWPKSAGWYLFALAGIPAACLIASMLGATVGGSELGRLDGRWREIALDALLGAATLPIAELGLRGFAQPLLQRRHGAIEASAIIGIMGVVVLLPAFTLAPGFSSPSITAPDLQLTAFAVRTIALSVILGVVYNRTQGSIPACMLVHWTASLSYPGAGTVGSLPAQALMFAVLAVSLGLGLRSRLRLGTLEHRVTRLPDMGT